MNIFSLLLKIFDETFYGIRNEISNVDSLVLIVLIENYSILNNTINANSIIGKLLSFRLEDTFYIFFSLFIVESCGPYFS